jgi:hypothetical protein
MSKPITIDAAMEDHKLLGAALGDLSTWRTWVAVLKAAYGRPLTKAERTAFDRVAGGRAPPRRKVRELVVVASRRSGKGRSAGAVSAFEAVLAPHPGLAAGEKGIVACISPTRQQAAIVQDYAAGFLRSSPIMAREVADITSDEIRLRNGNAIVTLAADYRSLRGRTLLLAVLDEAAFLRGEGAATDIETARALLPGLATTNGLLLILSSPYSRGGLVFERHRDYFGRDDDDVLVVGGPSILFNPTLDAPMIEAARAADPEGAASEWFGEFRRDLSALLDDAMIEAAIDHGRLESAPQARTRYFAHCDAAGGAGKGDAFTLAIGHKAKDGQLIVDLVRGAVGRFDPSQVVKNYAVLLREYRVGSIVGDHFAPGWVGGAFAEVGISYQRSEPNASEIYLHVVPLFARGVVRLPGHLRLQRELRQLERHAHRGGRETVDHPRRGSDDFVNVAAGVLRTLATAPPALWDQCDLLGDRVTVTRADAVYGVVVPSEWGVGAVFFAYRQIIAPKLIVLDYELVSPARFGDVVARLLEWGRELGALPVLFSSSLLGDQFRRLGHEPAVVDAVAQDPMLAVSAAIHIGTGIVKLSDQARLRAQTLPLGILDGTATDDDDPIRLAALIGIAVGCDAGRDLR